MLKEFFSPAEAATSAVADLIESGDVVPYRHGNGGQWFCTVDAAARFRRSLPHDNGAILAAEYNGNEDQETDAPQTYPLADFAVGCDMSAAQVMDLLDANGFEPVTEATYGDAACKFLLSRVFGLAADVDVDAETSPLPEIAAVCEMTPAMVRAMLDAACIEPEQEAEYGADAADYLIESLGLPQC